MQVFGRLISLPNHVNLISDGNEMINVFHVYDKFKFMNNYIRYENCNSNSMKLDLIKSDGTTIFSFQEYIYN